MAIAATYTAKTAAQLSDVTETMLDYLVREKFIVPSGSKVRGRGRARLFTFGDLVTLKVIARLLASGIEIRRLSKGLKALRDRLGQSDDISAKFRYLLSDGREIYLVEHGALESLTTNRQLAFAFLIDLPACKGEIDVARRKIEGSHAAVA